MTSLGTFFEEVASLIGKTKVAARQESVYMMGFLNLFWVTLVFGLIALLRPSSFIFSYASLPTFGIRMILEVVQAHVSILAVTRADRSTFGFIRVATVPLLLLVDLIMKYTLGSYQIVGMGIIVAVLILIFMNHGIRREGAWLTLFTAVNAVATSSLYKFDIVHFNSVVGEQLIIYGGLFLYFGIAARWIMKENIFTFFQRPAFLLQSLSQGLGGGIESFAMAFAPPSVILAAKRSSGVLWAVLSGNRYFHEQHFLLKMTLFLLIAVGLVLLIF